MKFRCLGSAALAAVAILVVVASPVAAHESPAAGAGLTESELRSFESYVLGPEHAAEHARERAESEPAPDRSASSRLSQAALATPGGAYDARQSLGSALEDDLAAQEGDWSTPFALPLYAIHAALLPTGKVLWIGPPDASFADSDSTWNTTWAVLWDPLSGELERVDPPLWRDPGDGQLKPANIYCAGQAFLASGELLVAGGTLGRDANNKPFGLNKVYTFDPFAEEWTEQPDMTHGRWYPTNVQLPDGRQAIMSGSNEVSADVYNETVEVFTPAADRGGQGTLTTLVDANGDPAERGSAGQPPTGGLYPHMFAMPSGKTLVAGPYQADSWYLHPPGDDDLLEWSDVGNLDYRRRYANGVIMPPPPGDTSPSSKALLLGGYGGSSDPEIDGKSLKSTVYFDDAQPGAGWRPETEMQVARSNQNTVLLPDRSMVQVGGGVGADLYGAVAEHQHVELWDPATKQWRLGAAQTEKRAYHSTAVLLPDGRVVSAGDDGNSGAVAALDTAEVYSPPYLFKGPRPTIAFAPETVELSDAFDVETPDDDIARAALIAPGATTHANDMHQRYVPLALEPEADGVQLTAPPNADAAPPGYYMLFLVDETGVPSIAEFVKVVPDRPDGEITIVNQAALSGAPESFDFTGDLGAFSLAHGASETESVPAGLHEVTQSARAGWTLTALSCSDGSATDLAGRRARIEVAPGESVTCTFTSTRDPDPDPPSGPRPAPRRDPSPRTPVAPKQDPDVESPPALTRPRAIALARMLVAKRLGHRKSKRGLKVACGRRAGGFRCTFELAHAYRGVLHVRDAGGRARAAGLTYAGSCGDLERLGPSAIRTRNLECPVARRLIASWVVGDRPPGAYDCTTRPAPRRTSCKASRRAFSFIPRPRP